MIKNIRPTSLLPWGLLLSLGTWLPTSCSLDIPLEDQYSDPDAIATVGNARSLLTSAYIAYPHYEYEFSVLGPDFCPSSLLGKDSDTKNLYHWQDNAINRIAQNLWLNYYNVISVCDILQERLHFVQVSQEKEQHELAAIEAESFAMEAMSYFNLLRIFAPAYDRNPLADGVILKTRVGVEFPKRSSIEDCVSEIRRLLLAAEKVENHPTANGWFSQTAVRYLLAELELYTGNYAQAARYAEMVLDQADPSYFSRQGYAKLWQSSSCPERIFAFNMSSPFYVSLEYDREEGDYFGVSPDITFSANDFRGETSIYPFRMGDSEHRLFGKYNLNNKEEKVNSYLNVMRYAGAYFIAAESYSRIPGSEKKGLQLLNSYLEKCGAELLSDELTGEALTQAILLEKQKEFVGEGVAYFDCKRTRIPALKRWNRWGQMVVESIKDTDYRWTFPIPMSEYKYNDIKQNEGWPTNR